MINFIFFSALILAILSTSSSIVAGAIAAGVVPNASEACEFIKSKGCSSDIFNDANVAFDHIYSARSRFHTYVDLGHCLDTTDYDSSDSNNDGGGSKSAIPVVVVVTAFATIKDGV